MAIRRLSLLIISILVLFGCAREGFEVSSLSISRTIEVDIDGEGKALSIVQSARINTFIEPQKESYAFKLGSPDGDLVWEGRIKGGRASSDALLITPFASFEEGAYSLILYSDEGETYSSSVSLEGVESVAYPYFDSSRILFSDREVSIDLYQDGVLEDTITADNGFELQGEYDKAVISFRDRFNNTIIVRENLN